jgi:hypothetical protein
MYSQAWQGVPGFNAAANAAAVSSIYDPPANTRAVRDLKAPAMLATAYPD